MSSDEEAPLEGSPAISKWILQSIATFRSRLPLILCGLVTLVIGIIVIGVFVGLTWGKVRDITSTSSASAAAAGGVPGSVQDLADVVARLPAAIQTLVANLLSGTVNTLLGDNAAQTTQLTGVITQASQTEVSQITAQTAQLTSVITQVSQAELTQIAAFLAALNASIQANLPSAPQPPVVPPAGCEIWYVPPVDRPANPAPGYLPFNAGQCPGNTSLCAVGVTKDTTLQLGSCCSTSLGLSVLATYWGPGYCLGQTNFGGVSTVPCPCSYKQQILRSGEYLTIHGLWRDYCDGSFPSGAATYANTGSRAITNDELAIALASDPELEQAMRFHWPNIIPNVTIQGDPYSRNLLTDLWVHEYNTHGVLDNTLWPGAGCYPTNAAPDRITRAKDFFRMALRVRQSFDFYEVMKSYGIVPSATYYNATTFLATVDQATGFATQVTCDRLAINNGTIGVVRELRTTFSVYNTVIYMPSPKIAAPHRCPGVTYIWYPRVEDMFNPNSIF